MVEKVLFRFPLSKHGKNDLLPYQLTLPGYHNRSNIQKGITKMYLSKLMNANYQPKEPAVILTTHDLRPTDNGLNMLAHVDSCATIGLPDTAVGGFE